MKARRVALILWAAMLAGLVVLLPVAALLGPTLETRADDALAPALLPLAALLAAGTLVASRLVPRWVAVPPGAADQAVLVKQMIACALCDGGALFAVVTWMLTGSPLALGLLLLPLAGLAAAWPGDARWAALGGTVDGAPGAPRSPPGPNQPGVR